MIIQAPVHTKPNQDSLCPYNATPQASQSFSPNCVPVLNLKPFAYTHDYASYVDNCDLSMLYILWHPQYQHKVANITGD